ncbi:MAG: FAD-binding oxidoreductase [Nanoarchaeota archaeon]
MLKNKLLRIKEIKQETHDTKTYKFDTKGLNEIFLPGQFYMVSAVINGIEVKRAYSIASSPTEKGIIAITIKIMNGGKFSTHSFERFKKGDEVNFTGPYGKFVYHDELKPVYLLGGGSGVAPLRAIMKYIIDKNIQVPVKLICSNHTPKDIIFKEEFEQWAEEHKNISCYFTITSPNGVVWNGHVGRLDQEVIKKEVDDVDGLFFICGPPVLVKAIETSLIMLGVREENIRTEKYN